MSNKTATQIITLLAVATGWTIYGLNANSIVSIPLFETSAEQHSELEWRYTSQGWKQLAISRPYTFQVPEAERTLHPIVWLGLMMMLLGGSMTWASSEWERSQLFGSIKRKCLRLVPGTVGKAD